MLSVRSPGRRYEIFSLNSRPTAFCIALMLLFFANAVSATTLTWDPVGPPGVITDGPGVWDTTSLNWTADNGNTRTAWVNGDDAVIGGGTAGSAGTITIGSGGVQVQSITCNPPNGGGSYTITGGTLTLSGNSVNTNSQNLAVSSVISGSAGLAKTGTGMLTLGGANTYTGTTTISGGTLQVGTGGTSGNLGSSAVTDNANLVFNRSDAITIGNAIGGTGNVVQNGTGTTTLTAQNSFTGTTTVNAGILVGDWGGNNAIGALGTTSLITVNSGGTLRAGGTSNNGFLGSSPTGGAILLNSGGVLDTTSDSLTDHLNTVTLAGGTLGGTGPLPAGSAAESCGRWALDKTITVQGGTGVTSTISANGLALTQTGGTQFNVGSSGAPGGIDLLVSGILYHYGVTGCGTDNVGFIKSGAGNMVLTGANTYISQTTISSGALLVGNGGTTGNLGSGAVTDNANLVFNLSNALTVPGNILGTGNLVQNGTGTTSLSGATMTYSGTTLVNNGILNFTAAVPSSNTWNLTFRGPSSYAQLLLPTAPDLAGKTVDVNLTFSNGPYNITIVSWTGSASNTPLLQINRVAVASGQQVNNTSIIYSPGSGLNVTALAVPAPTPTATPAPVNHGSGRNVYWEQSENRGNYGYTGPAPTQIMPGPARVPAVQQTMVTGAGSAMPTEPPLPANTPRSGPDAVPVLCALGLCGVISRFRKDGN